MPPKKKKPKIAIIADLHIDNHAQHGGTPRAGLNDRGRECLDAFRRAVTVARDNGALVLFIAGDLFNKCRPEPSLIAGVKHVLDEEAKGLSVVLIPGNHDMPDATAAQGNTAMAPLFNEATIITVPTWVPVHEVGINVLCIPFQSAVPMRDYLLKAPDNVTLDSDDASLPRILITHVGVYGDDLGQGGWMARANDAIHCDALFDVMASQAIFEAFVGNFHHAQTWQRSDRDGPYRITQVGTTIPHSYGDDGGFPRVGGITFFDGNDITALEVPGPRFFKVDAPEDAAQAQALLGDEKHQVYVRLGTAVAALQMQLFQGGANVDEAQAPDTGPDLGPLPQVSDAKGAIAEFIAGMVLPDGVVRDDVHAEALEVWNTLAAGG